VLDAWISPMTDSQLKREWSKPQLTVYRIEELLRPDAGHEVHPIPVSNTENLENQRNLRLLSAVRVSGTSDVMG
jgi:hypothetical protein